MFVLSSNSCHLPFCFLWQIFILWSGSQCSPGLARTIYFISNTTKVCCILDTFLGCFITLWYMTTLVSTIDLVCESIFFCTTSLFQTEFYAQLMVARLVLVTSSAHQFTCSPYKLKYWQQNQGIHLREQLIFHRYILKPLFRQCNEIHIIGLRECLQIPSDCYCKILLILNR